MSMVNVVRFRVKPGMEDTFLDAHRDGRARWPGLARGRIIRTGDRAYCLIGEWESREAMVAARAAMIATLDTFRSSLEDQGEGRGLTDAVSGEAVLELV
jgi:quinol monooxygenase YgiN